MSGNNASSSCPIPLPTGLQRHVIQLEPFANAMDQAVTEQEYSIEIVVGKRSRVNNTFAPSGVVRRLLPRRPKDGKSKATPTGPRSSASYPSQLQWIRSYIPSNLSYYVVDTTPPTSPFDQLDLTFPPDLAKPRRQRKQREERERKGLRRSKRDRIPYNSSHPLVVDAPIGSEVYYVLYRNGKEVDEVQVPPSQ